MLNNLEDYDYASRLWGCRGKACFVSASEGAGINTQVFNIKNRLSIRPDIRKELGIEKNELVIGYIGRCLWKKGMGDFLKAAYILKSKGLSPRTRYLVVGTGSDFNEITREVERLGLDGDVIFSGYKSDVRRYFSALDIFVHPSYWEGLPTTLLQAMAMGLPSIATDVRGSRELIEHGKSGIIVDIRSPEAIAEAVAGLLKDRARAEAMAREAHRRISENYSQEVLLPRTIEIVNNMYIAKKVK
jgi:glycosyltransferase involved in cell wall biosynthesis